MSKLIFVFVIVFIILSACNSHKKLSCDQFKTGHFTLHSEFDSSMSFIERNDSIQTEINSNSKNIVKAKIKWKGECEYELTYLEQTTNSPDTINSFIQSRVLNVIILEATKDYYIFKATMADTDKTLTDTLRILNNTED